MARGRKGGGIMGIIIGIVLMLVVGAILYAVLGGFAAGSSAPTPTGDAGAPTDGTAGDGKSWYDRIWDGVTNTWNGLPDWTDVPGVGTGK